MQKYIACGHERSMWWCHDRARGLSLDSFEGLGFNCNAPSPKPKRMPHANSRQLYGFKFQPNLNPPSRNPKPGRPSKRTADRSSPAAPTLAASSQTAVTPPCPIASALWRRAPGARGAQRRVPATR
eukprot:363941-Chlamydomonas_euryale.AAC.6